MQMPEKKPDLGLNADAVLVTGEADTESTLSRAAAAAAGLVVHDVPVAIWQNGLVLFEFGGKDAPMQGHPEVVQAVRGFIEDIVKAWELAKESAGG